MKALKELFQMIFTPTGNKKKTDELTAAEVITNENELIKAHNEMALDNDFMRLSRVNATLRTNKLISLIFSYLDFKADNTNSDGELIVTIENSKINNFITSSGVAYHDSDFKDIARDIIQTSIVYGKLNGFNVSFPIIDFVQENKNRTFTFKINPIFKPYVQELQNRYSVLQLDTIQKFKSNHAFVLYQELTSWYIRDKKDMSIKEQYYKTSDLFKLFNLDKTDYHTKNGKLDRFNFEKKVIDKAVDEINASGELRVIYEKIKEGNKVKAYKFTYTSWKDYQNSEAWDKAF